MLNINGTVYLNTTESAKHLGWCLKTFTIYAKDLKRYTFSHKQGIFYLRDDLQRFFLPIGEQSLEQRLADVARSVLRNTPMDELTPEWQALKREVEEEVN